MADTMTNTSEMNSTVEIMRRQEETNYVKCDVFHQLTSEQSLIVDHDRCAQIEINEECRCKMVEWCYQVIDFCEMSKETVEIAMSYLDRFLLTCDGLSAAQDRSTYQVACMASLYTAIKMHEHRVICPDFVSRLSQGAYCSSEIEAMETRIVMSLNWYMNPPTSFSFVREYLNLLPNEFMDQQTKDVAYDLSRLQCEAALKIYELSTIRASTIAYCSLMNALESMSADFKLIACVQFLINHSIIDCCTNENSEAIFRKEMKCIQRLLHESITLDRCPVFDVPVSSDIETKTTACNYHHRCANETDMEYSPRSSSTTAFESNRIVV